MRCTVLRGGADCFIETTIYQNRGYFTKIGNLSCLDWGSALNNTPRSQETKTPTKRLQNFPPRPSPKRQSQPP